MWECCWLAGDAVVHLGALPSSTIREGGLRQVRRKRQRLQASEDAVTTKDRHVPGQPRCRQRFAGEDARIDPQRRKIDEAPLIDALHRVPVTLKLWRRREPGLQTLRALSTHIGPRLFVC